MTQSKNEDSNWMLAMRVAKLEKRIEDILLHRTKPGQEGLQAELLNQLRVSLELAQAVLDDDSVAKLMLGQARVFTSLAINRQTVVRNSSLGMFNNVLRHQSSHMTLQNPFSDKVKNKHWKDFLKALNVGDVQNVLESLLWLTDEIMSDIQNDMELPPRVK